MKEKPRYKAFYGDKMPCMPNDRVEIVWRMIGQGVIKTKTIAEEFSWGYMEKENIICYRAL